jgi:(E)-4-hydroxy-3-methylbut-2-enyl-diphosphate synthase
MSVGWADPFRPTRRPTRVVRVGGIDIGGDNPVRIQSMTNTDTMDTEATVEQTIRLAQAGCEIVRITAPSIRDAENLREIRKRLLSRGVDVPLVADIHFTPNAAMIAADVVEKVRINPGNYADKKKFEVREYDDAQYEAEIDRVRERFRPLVVRCKENGVAMRIGTNHGSLSDRIMNRFGDTPQGMVESALEFLDVCEDEGYFDVIFSMKSSNTQVAIQAYRFLAARLEERRPGEPSYPFHVGVTEAGDAEDGRIKSAIGIGSLLEDGLGDTIRVSLTEDPVREVPVARAIAERAARVRAERSGVLDPIEVSSPPVPDPYDHVRRGSKKSRWGDLEVGGDSLIRVELEVDEALDAPERSAAQLAMQLSALRDVEAESLLVTASGALGWTRLAEFKSELTTLGHDVPVSVRVEPEDEALLGAAASESSCAGRWVVRLSANSGSESTAARMAEAAGKARVDLEWELVGRDYEIPALVRAALGVCRRANVSPTFSLDPGATLHAHRVLVSALADASDFSDVSDVSNAFNVSDAASAMIVLRQRLDAGKRLPQGIAGAEGVPEMALLDASVRLGGLLCDGIGDALSMQTRGSAAGAVDLAYRVLQGARQRTTRTEYISCPSCGRTLFDLEETTARIKARTDHLSGVKIAIMGCIVNGPGEMADADFGYVGSGVGQVTLYVGKEIVARAVPEAEATDRLVDLIREHGQWVDGAEVATDSSTA